MGQGKVDRDRRLKLADLLGFLGFETDGMILCRPLVDKFKLRFLLDRRSQIEKSIM